MLPGWSSGISLKAAGRLKTTQWPLVPGVSASSTIIARVCVPEGGAVQERGGDTLALSQVYRTGIVPPGENAEVSRTKGSGVGVAVGIGVGVGTGVGVGVGAGVGVCVGASVGAAVGMGDGAAVGVGLGSGVGVGVGTKVGVGVAAG